MVSKDLTFNLFGRDVNAGAAMRKVAVSAEESSRGIKKAFGELPKMAAAASVGAVAGSVYLAAGFQAASLRLVTDAGESAKSLNMVKQGMLDIASQTGLTAGEVNSGMYLVESAGYHGAAGLKVMSAAAQGAKIGGADVKTVADALTTAMTDYSFPAGKAAEVTSKLIATVGQGKTTMEELAGSLHNVLPTAASLHLSFAQVTGAMATMTAEGISADQASQNLNHALISLASPTQVQTKEMAAMGLNSTTVAQQLGKKGLTGTLDELVTAITSHMGKGGLVLQNAFNQSKLAAQSANTMFKSLPASVQSVATAYQKGTITQKDWTTAVKAMTPEQANLAKQWASSENASKGFSAALTSNQGAAQTFTAALSKMTGGQQGLSVALHLTGDHMGAFENNVKIIGAASSEAGGKVKGWAETQTNFNQQLAQARSTLEAVGITVGTTLLPAFTQGVRAFGGFFGALRGGSPAAIALVAVIGGVVAGLTGLYVATKIYAGVQAAAAIAMWAFGSAETAGTLRANIHTAALAAQKVALGISTAAQWAFNVAMDANPIGLIIIAIIALIAIIVLLVTHWKQVCAFLQTVWGAVCKWFGDTLKSVGQLWSTLWKANQRLFETVWRAITGFFRGIWNGIVSWFVASARGYVNFWRGLWNDVVNFFHTAWNRAVAIVRAIPGQIMGFFRNAGSWLLNAGRNVIQGLINGITSSIGAVANAVSNIAGNVVGTFKNILGIHSPSTVFAEHGKNIVQGLINGLTGNTAGVHAAVAGLVPGVAGSSIGVKVAGSVAEATVGVNRAAAAGGLTVNVTVQGAVVGTTAQLGQYVYNAVKQGVRQGAVPKTAFTTL